MVAALLALSACAETQLLFHTAKQVQRPTLPRQSAAIPSEPGYKIGDPYQIRGTWYYPSENLRYRETGIASWYGTEFHGLQTANGEVFDMGALTAAHRTLPMPSAVRVTNLENGRSMVLRVNDRGPFRRSRIIDVSRQAARMLGFEGKGTAKVDVAILPQESRQLKLAALNAPASQQVAVRAAPRVAVKTEPLPRVVSVAGGDPTADHVIGSKGANGSILERVRQGQTPLPTTVSYVPVPDSEIYIQLGAFGDLGNALRLRDRLYATYPSAFIRRVRLGTEELYRVRLGPFDEVEAADTLLLHVLNTVTSDARLVVE